MLKKIAFIFFILVCVFTFNPKITNAEEELPQASVTETTDFNASSYELISPIGNLSKIDDQDSNGFSGFINLVITIAIALAGAIAVITIIVSGIQYMGTDSVWEKGESKMKISTAVGGIVLLLCSYIILNTINPDLVNIKIGGMNKISDAEWPTVTFTYGEDGKVLTDFKYNKADSVKDACTGEPGQSVSGSCQDITTQGWVVKNGKHTSKELSERLTVFKSLIDQNSSIKGKYVVTEAMPQSVVHKNSCHKTGTCVDFAFTDPNLYNDISVLTYIDQSANKSKLCSVFEGKPGDSMVSAAKSKGLGAGAYSWVTGRHFSIYGWTGCQ